MSHPIEERLRDAYQAKAGQLTEARLDQLTAAREHGLDELLGTEHTAELPIVDTAPNRRQHRWLAPGLAAAAIAAVAVGAVMIATGQPDSRPHPHPAATHVSSPPTSAPTPAPTASQTHGQPVAAPPYLPAGQTGSRDQVPWSAVGSGWRLLQRQNPGDYATYDRKLYLYDPAGGRYLITDALPVQSRLLAWSPDGQRAMVQMLNDGRFRQFDLRTGNVVSTATLPQAAFTTYTTPRGLAMVMVDDSNPVKPQFKRFATDGTLELTYSNPALLTTERVLYTPDGTELIGDTSSATVLLGNDGHLIRQFPVPAGYSRCYVLKWWTESAVLEVCSNNLSFSALFVQQVAGGSPSRLTSGNGKYGMGYANGWRLSNGDVLLENISGCGDAGYQVLATDGTIHPLRLPAGVTEPGYIANMDGDLATFLQRNFPGCGGTNRPRYSLIDYNMVTGQTRTLLDGLAVIVGWPGDQG
ncbi:MAG TPA: hypothetical protein VFU36_13540 [Jatrophihabitans sp.]|nr:hypothetical protein [Jatrophihabitans sp.]